MSDAEYDNNLKTTALDEKDNMQLISNKTNKPSFSGNVRSRVNVKNKTDIEAGEFLQNNDGTSITQYEYILNKYNDLLAFHNSLFWFGLLVIILGGIILGVFIYELWSIDVVTVEKAFVKYMIIPIYVILVVMLLSFRKDPKLTIFTLMSCVFITAYLFGTVTTTMFKSFIELDKTP